MKKVISFWENQSKNGNIYYTGKIGEVELIGFRVKEKKSEKSPDLEFFIREEKKEKPKEIKKEDPYSEFAKEIELEITDNLLDD